MDELDKLFNGWGKPMESLVEGDLVGLLQSAPCAVQHTVTNPRQNYGERRWELDIVAVGEEVVVVEVKTTLRVPALGRLNEFPDLMPRRAADLRGCLSEYQESDVRAERLGLFVIRATGSSASITNREEFAHVRSPEHGTQPPIARSRPPFVSKWPSPDGEYAEQEPHEPQARNRV